MLSKNLIDYVDSKGIKYKAIADGTGINYQSLLYSIRKIKSGDPRGDFSCDEYDRICLFLDIPLDQLRDEHSVAPS